MAVHVRNLCDAEQKVFHPSPLHTAQPASRVEEGLADAGFANLARCQFGLTPYTVAAEPKLRIAPYIIMLHE